ncbi:MAG: hypothetical protein ACXWWQ_01675 [Candidatus Limnocylindria bacterium]
MKRVLIVYHDTEIADIDADELRRAGYEVDHCAGPIGGSPCPVLEGGPCWQVEKADVLVYDTWDVGRGGHDLITELRARHPDKPVVLTSPGPMVDRGPTDGRDGVTPIFHAPTRATLAATVERALRTPKQPKGEAAAESAEEHAADAYHGPRW